jgi:hypothetical protein
LKGCCIPGLGPDVPPVCGNFVTAVKNQRSCGDCWAFSVIGALESQFLIKFLTPGKKLNLSEQILLSCSGGGSGNYGCSGGYTTTASQFLHNSGTGKESCYSYKAKDVSEGASCSAACLNWHYLPYQLNGSDYGTQSNPTVAQLKSLITQYGPVSVTMGVYQDFYYYKKGVYQYTYGSFVGGHAILAVGYHDDPNVSGGGYFIVKNSWGTSWGMSGFFEIAYSELTGTTKFGRWSGNPTVFYYGVNPVTLWIESPDKNDQLCHSGKTCNVVFDAPPFNWYTFVVSYKVGSGKWTLISKWDGPGGHFTESFTAPTVTKATKSYFQIIQHYPAGSTKVAAEVTSAPFWIVPTGTVTVAAISLPETGQKTSYASGDDGNLQKGVAWPNPRFTNNGDQTITDNLTGLMWTQDGNAPGPNTCTPSVQKSWQDALNYASCLNTNNYLGHNDWRLPNINELCSLINYGQSNPATWLNAQGFSNVQANWYWSSTTYSPITDYAWQVGVDFGDVDSYYKTYGYPVWPVRAGQ